ncbi:fusobacterium outer membrane protein [Anopheles sinensis]|uniref:Fusobacterium outer membrane protein n=1 Tax=Anopheles sinensis TaxID=74873 RepID=A0A084VCX1_ANOSI|nr:fusobacterium outer membrane protein [Anopheles sinensis]
MECLKTARRVSVYLCNNLKVKRLPPALGWSAEVRGQPKDRIYYERCFLERNSGSRTPGEIPIPIGSCWHNAPGPFPPAPCADLAEFTPGVVRNPQNPALVIVPPPVAPLMAPPKMPEKMKGTHSNVRFYRDCPRGQWRCSGNSSKVAAQRRRDEKLSSSSERPVRHNFKRLPHDTEM